MHSVLSFIAALLISFGALSPGWAASPCHPIGAASAKDCCQGDSKCPMPGMACAAACAPATIAEAAPIGRALADPAPYVSPTESTFAGRPGRPPLPPPRARAFTN